MSISTGFNVNLNCLPIPEHNQTLLENFITANLGLSDMGYIAGFDHFGSLCFDGKLYI